MKIKKVGFDFDGTLSRRVVQEYAASLISREDVEVHIITAREQNSHLGNEDLFKVAAELGIPQERIHFTNYIEKGLSFFKDNLDFIWHLDDVTIELSCINVYTSVVGIDVNAFNWVTYCNDLLK